MVSLSPHNSEAAASQSGKTKSAKTEKASHSESRTSHSRNALTVIAKPPESFPEETSLAEILAMKKPTVEVFAAQIGLRWQKSVRGIVEAGQLAAHAYATLKKSNQTTRSCLWSGLA
jgi:hypothetical protein